MDKNKPEIDEAKKTDFSKEKSQGLHGWFARKGGDGSSGWVDCNTCRKDPETGKKKCKPCGRQDGEKRKYPACRPTPASCGTRGKGEKWGKKSNNENVELQDEEITVYHGGPHSFDRFSTQHMGTGEGAQAFGWGIYFTDLKSIAKYYAEQLTSSKQEELGFFEILDDRLEDFDYYKYELSYLGINKRGNDALNKLIKDTNFHKKDVQKFIKSTKPDDINYVNYLNKQIKIAEDIIDEAKNYLKKLPSKNLYKVTLHKGKTPEQYTWLEWDKALSEKQQNKLLALPEVKKLINNIQKRRYDLSKKFADKGITKEFKTPLTGEDIYKGLSKVIGSDKATSELLLKNGIDGIKFPAESIARGATSNTARGFNYVVFDENAINIEKKLQFENKNNMENLIKQKLQEMVEEGHSEFQNYMFFNNLKTIHDAITKILEMDSQAVDQLLSDGHNWATDHLATSADDIDEVYHFLSAELNGSESDSYDGETEGGYEDEYGSVETIAISEAEYKGKKVKLGKPTHGDVKKFKVYVKNKKGNVIKVNFGDPNMEIKRDNPKRKKLFRARHKCSMAKDRTTPKYWSCKMWSNKPVSKIVGENFEAQEKTSIFVNKEILRAKIRETFNQDNMQQETKPLILPETKPVKPVETKPNRIDKPFLPEVLPGTITQPKAVKEGKK